MMKIRLGCEFLSGTNTLTFLWQAPATKISLVFIILSSANTTAYLLRASAMKIRLGCKGLSGTNVLAYL